MDNWDSSRSLRSRSNNTLRGNSISYNDWCKTSLSGPSNKNLIEKIMPCEIGLRRYI